MNYQERKLEELINARLRIEDAFYQIFDENAGKFCRKLNDEDGLSEGYLSVTQRLCAVTRIFDQLVMKRQSFKIELIEKIFNDLKNENTINDEL